MIAREGVVAGGPAAARLGRGYVLAVRGEVDDDRSVRLGLGSRGRGGRRRVRGARPRVAADVAVAVAVVVHRGRARVDRAPLEAERARGECLDATKGRGETQLFPHEPRGCFLCCSRESSCLSDWAPYATNFFAPAHDGRDSTPRVTRPRAKAPALPASSSVPPREPRTLDDPPGPVARSSRPEDSSDC